MKAIAIGAGVGAIGLLLYARWKAAQPPPAGGDKCDQAALAAERLQPGSGQAARLACQALEQVGGVVISAGQKLTGIAAQGVNGVVKTVTGQSDRPDKLKLDRKACPSGTKFAIFKRELNDHRGLEGLSDRAYSTGNLGAVCKDAKGNIVGTVMPDGFHPFDYTKAIAKPPPPIAARPSSRGSSRGSAVKVTDTPGAKPRS